MLVLFRESECRAPTAAAEMVAFDTDSMARDIISQISIAGRKLENKIKTKQLIATDLTRKSTYLIGNKLSEMENRVKDALSGSRLSIQERLYRKEGEVNVLFNKIEALNPLRILKTGYLKGEIDGKGISSVKSLKEGDTITLYANDGKIKATVNEIESN